MSRFSGVRDENLPKRPFNFPKGKHLENRSLRNRLVGVEVGCHAVSRVGGVDSRTHCTKCMFCILRPFHGGNGGSNPPGDAIFFNSLCFIELGKMDFPKRFQNGGAGFRVIPAHAAEVDLQPLETVNPAQGQAVHIPMVAGTCFGENDHLSMAEIELIA